MAKHRIDVEGGKCYVLALAWGYDREAQVSVGFEKGADGKTANDQVGGAAARLKVPGGVAPFCADRNGSATITVSAVTPQGSIANNELLEYALVLGSRPESGDQTTARRASETDAAARAQARIDTNIAISKERDRQNLERRCSDCRDEYHACQVDRAYAQHHPQPGVSVTQSCESRYQLCAFGGSTFEAQRHPGEMPCGAPPR